MTLTSPKNQATRYPNTIVSFVSESFGGVGIPAKFQRSPFHSSNLITPSHKVRQSAGQLVCLVTFLVEVKSVWVW